MRIRTRKLIGTIVLLAFVMIWPVFAGGLLLAAIAKLPAATKIAALAVIGLVWVIPAGLLIRWMQRPDPEES
jgi:hypothetical protein